MAAKKILMLVGANGLSYEEAANVIGCAVGTVRSRLSRARTELEGHVAVLVLGAVGDDLATFEAEDRHGHVGAGFVEEASHTHFLGDYAGSHRINPLRA